MFLQESSSIKGGKYTLLYFRLPRKNNRLTTTPKMFECNRGLVSLLLCVAMCTAQSNCVKKKNEKRNTPSPKPMHRKQQPFLLKKKMLHKPATAYGNGHIRISETKRRTRNKIVCTLALSSCQQRLLRQPVFSIELLRRGCFEVKFFPDRNSRGSKKPFLRRRGNNPFQRGKEEHYKKQYCFQKICMACTFHGAKVRKTAGAT